jgi:hypothetical protein
MQLNLRTPESRRILDARIAEKTALVAKLEAKGFKPSTSWDHPTEQERIARAIYKDEQFALNGGRYRRIIQTYVKGNRRIQLNMRQHDDRTFVVGDYRRKNQRRAKMVKFEEIKI